MVFNTRVVVLNAQLVCTLFDRTGRALVGLSTEAKKFSGGQELQA